MKNIRNLLYEGEHQSPFKNLLYILNSVLFSTQFDHRENIWKSNHISTILTTSFPPQSLHARSQRSSKATPSSPPHTQWRPTVPGTGSSHKSSLQIRKTLETSLRLGWTWRWAAGKILRFSRAGRSPFCPLGSAPLFAGKYPSYPFTDPHPKRHFTHSPLFLNVLCVCMGSDGWIYHCPSHHDVPWQDQNQDQVSELIHQQGSLDGTGIGRDRMEQNAGPGRSFVIDYCIKVTPGRAFIISSYPVWCLKSGCRQQQQQASSGTPMILALIWLKICKVFLNIFESSDTIF